MYKSLADNTLLNMTKKEIIEYLRIAERNNKVCEETLETQAKNFEKLLSEERNKAIDDFENKLVEKIAEKLKAGGKMSDKQTNADRIRNMSDEELAEWINTKNMCEQCANYYEPESECREPCTSNILRWLQSVAE